MYFHEIVIVINIVDNIIYKSEREVFLIFTLFFVRRRAIVSDVRVEPNKVVQCVAHRNQSRTQHSIV